MKSMVAQHCKNLTLADWLTVFKFIDDHPGIKKMQVVRHFKFSRLARRALSFLCSQYFHENWNSTVSPYAFPGGDLEIVTQIRYEKKVQCGEIMLISDLSALSGSKWT